MKIIIGTQKGKIVTDNPKLLSALQRLYTFKVPGASYSAAYRRRSWDGKKRFISDTGSFRSGLLPKILEHLKKIDCVPEVEFKPPRPKCPKLLSFSNMKYLGFNSFNNLT